MTLRECLRGILYYIKTQTLYTHHAVGIVRPTSAAAVPE